MVGADVQRALAIFPIEAIVMPILQLTLLVSRC